MKPVTVRIWLSSRLTKLMRPAGWSWDTKMRWRVSSASPENPPADSLLPEAY